jgi:hypothetical protein
MTTASPKLPPTTPQQQLSLPLTPAPAQRLISLSQVWPTLTPPQQTHLFQQLVSICCRLLNQPQTKEVTDEPQ